MRKLILEFLMKNRISFYDLIAIAAVIQFMKDGQWIMVIIIALMAGFIWAFIQQYVED